MTRTVIIAALGDLLFAPTLGVDLTQAKTSLGAAPPVGMTDTNEIVFIRATVFESAPPFQVRLDAAVLPVGISFPGTPTATSGAVPSGSVAELSITPAAITACRWRARSILGADESAWVEFGGNPTAEPDCVGDLTVPTSTIPTTGNLGPVTYPGMIQGMDADGGSGVASIAVSVRWVSANLVWNDSTFVAAPVFLPATGTSPWLLPFSPADNQTYEVSSRATAAAGNVQSPDGPSTFTFDGSGPNSTILTTGWYTTGTFPGAISGTATTGAGATITRVEVSVERITDGMFWDGASFTSASAFFLPATGTTTWTLAVSVADGETCIGRARTTDAAVTESPPATSTFTISESNGGGATSVTVKAERSRVRCQLSAAGSGRGAALALVLVLTILSGNRALRRRVVRV